jgi:hypothetical protein
MIAASSQSPKLFARLLLPRGNANSGIYASAVTLATCVAMIHGAGIARGGPCTDQIAQLKEEIAVISPGPESGPTGSQSIGAQLHHQPTPNSVEHAEHVANADADAALERAQKADAEGQADSCKKWLTEARRLYGINQ